MRKSTHAWVTVGLLAATFGLLALPALPQAPAPTGSPVRGVPQNPGTINHSAVITLGNTFQQILPAVGSGYRASLTIQNNNTGTDNCFVFIGPTASATKGTSILLATGIAYVRYWPNVPGDNIAATCDNTSDTLYVDTQ